MIRLLFILMILNAPIAYSTDTKADNLKLQNNIATANQVNVKPPAVAIKIGGLEKISPNIIGIINSTNGGLNYNAWQGTSTMQAELLISQLSNNIKIKTIRDLQKKLLLSSTKSPIGKGQLDNMLSLKLSKLIAMKEYQSASDFIDLIPNNFIDENISQMKIFALFSLKKDKESCNYINSQNYISLNWSKNKILCNFVNNELDQAELNISLIAEKDEKFALEISKILTKSYNKKETSIQIEEIKRIILQQNHNIKNPVLPDVKIITIPQQIMDMVENSDNNIISKQQLENWQKNLLDIKDSNQQIIALAKIYTILESFNYDINTKFWNDLLYLRQQSDINLIKLNIEKLSLEKKIAETIALIIIEIGDKETIESDLLKIVINALINLDMSEYAISLANEIKI